ncbi:MAG: hypothetical protein DRP54_04005 [Spirochaetes bacterium]|nr:MAG: hypothetical protein DRP54_04005 [Spirochaetota bacterium]
MNSTRVYSDNGVSLPCEISGNILKWKASLNEGKNKFFIEFYKTSDPINCADTIPDSANRTLAGVVEKNTALSLSKINEFLATDYSTIKKSLDITSEFVVFLNLSKNLISYGKLPPHYVDVYSREFSLPVIETGEDAKINVLVW